MQLLVVGVQADEDRVGEALVALLHPGLDALERGDVAGGAAVEVDGEQVPVLVAADVLDVEQVTVVVGPEEGADAPVAVLGDRLGLLERRAHGVDPHVQHAGVGRDPRQPGAVGRDAGADPLGVAEQDLARDERCSHGRSLARRPSYSLDIHARYLYGPGHAPRPPCAPLERAGARVRVEARGRGRVRRAVAAGEHRPDLQDARPARGRRAGALGQRGPGQPARQEGVRAHRRRAGRARGMGRRPVARRPGQGRVLHQAGAGRPGQGGRPARPHRPPAPGPPAPVAGGDRPGRDRRRGWRHAWPSKALCCTCKPISSGSNAASRRSRPEGTHDVDPAHGGPPPALHGGRDGGPGRRRHRPHRRRGRVRQRDGAERVREVDPASPARGPRPADQLVRSTWATCGSTG